VNSDEGALEELLALGPKQLPVVSKNGKWVNGQSLKPVADLVGIVLGEIKHLPPAELARRIDLVVEGAGRFFAQFPQAHLDDQLPGRPRSLAQLTWHLFNVVDAFLEHEQGIPLVNGAYNRLPETGASRADILAYGADVRKRFAVWWTTQQSRTEWSQPAKVYYGNVAIHEFLERTTWHAGQHSRQLMWALEDKYKIKPDGPFGPDMWHGLPMPEQVWDS
jgi:hypothetical protein